MNMEIKQDSFRSGMVIVLLTNILNLLLNVALNFIQPKVLPVETYAAIKTFSLYMSCIGLFHLGYEDGVYLKYGGMEIAQANHRALSASISTLRLFQTLVSLVVLGIGVLKNAPLVAFLGMLILPYNMMMYFRLLYQATGKFSLYGRILNTTTIFLFVGNLMLMFLFSSSSYLPYVALNILIYSVVWLLLERQFSVKFDCRIQLLAFSVREFKQSICTGFPVLIGNFISIFLTSVDRWFVKYLFPSLAFAQYSFAVSMESFLNYAISPFSVTLYNYFCKETREEKIQTVQKAILILASVLVACAFPAKFILEVWLTSYLGSADVLFYLFGAQIYFMIIQCVYVNLYKAQKKQRLYSRRLITVLISGVVFNILFYLILRTKEAMAIGTLCTALLWFVFCQVDFKNIRCSWKQLLFLGAETAIFISAGNTMPALPGCLLYAGLTLLLIVAFFKKDFREFSKILKNRG